VNYFISLNPFYPELEKTLFLSNGEEQAVLDGRTNNIRRR
jgi:hypothetical protein